MPKTRKRSRHAPSLGWECALARLEERLLLSGSALIGPSAAIVATTGGPASARVSPAGDVISSSPTLVTSSPQTVDFADTGSSSPGAVSPAGGLISSPVDSFLGSPDGPTSADGLTLGAGSSSGPEESPALIGEEIGPRSEGIQATVLKPMESYYFSYSPLDSAAMGILPTTGGGPCASMASIVGEWVGVDADLADPPAPPQPSPGPMPTVVRVDGAEAAVADAPSGAPAAPADPVVEPAPADPEAPADPPSGGDEPAPEASPDPIGVGLRLSAPLLDVAGWDEAVSRLVEGVDDLVAGIEDLGAEPTYLPWAVAAGLMLTASEAARRARPRPSLAAAFVDGSVSVVDPDDAPRAPSRSRSVRMLLARGLSRWTTRR